MHSFLNGISLVFFETTANTLFLVKYDTSELPFVYVLSAVLSVVFGLVYSKLEENLNVEKLLRITLFFLLGITLFFFTLIKIYNFDFAYMGIMIFKDIMWLFAGIEFGILTSMIFDIRQGKRLFGLLMSGEILAGIIGGLSIGMLLSIMSTIDLLIISSISMILSFILLLNILKKFSSKFEEGNQVLDEDDNESNLSYKDLLKNNYYLLFFTISVLSFFVFYFIDYIFYFKVEERFTDEKELATFFGIFIAFLNIINLITSVFISGKVLSRYGLIFGLMAIPLMAIVGTSSYLAIAGISLTLAFFILIGMKILNEVMDISIVTPTFRIIYQSIPASQRNKVLAFRETIIEPTAMGIAGALLLLLSMFEGIWLVCMIIIILSAIWLFLSKLFKDKYIESLKSLLQKRQVVHDVNILENIDINIILNSLNSDNEIEVIYALDSLEKMNYKNIEEVLINAFEHKSILVRKKVLEISSSKKLISLTTSLEKWLLVEKDSGVLTALIHTYCQLDEVEAIEKIKPFIYSQNNIIRNGTMVALIKYCGIDGILIASRVINELIDNQDEKSRIEVLQIIQGAGVSGFYELLKESLLSQSSSIKTEAIKTVGNLKIKKFTPILIENLDDKRYKAITIHALSNYKEEVIDELKNEFQETTSYDKKLSLIKLLATIKSKESIKFLFKQIKSSSFIYNIIDSLYQVDYHTKNKKIILELLDENIKRILDVMVRLKQFNKEKYPNTYNVMEEEKSRKIDTIFKLLSFIYQKEIINQARINYNSSSNEVQALSVELLDNLLDTKLKQKIISILENISDDNKISHYVNNGTYKIVEQTEEQYFISLLQNQSLEFIIRLSLIYEIGLNKETKYRNILELVLENDTNQYIIETTQWCLQQFTIKG